jgi:hypothetical protein
MRQLPGTACRMLAVLSQQASSVRLQRKDGWRWAALAAVVTRAERYSRCIIVACVHRWRVQAGVRVAGVDKITTGSRATAKTKS